VRVHELNITTLHYSVKANAFIILIFAFNRHSAKGDCPMVRTMGRWQVQDRLSVVTALDSDSSSSEESSPREGGHDVRRETDTQAAHDAPSPAMSSAAATPQEQARSTCYKPPSTAQILREIASSDRQVCLHAQPFLPLLSAFKSVLTPHFHALLTLSGSHHAPGRCCVGVLYCWRSAREG
jgi:hypothetical protein